MKQQGELETASYCAAACCAAAVAAPSLATEFKALELKPSCKLTELDEMEPFLTDPAELQQLRDMFADRQEDADACACEGTPANGLAEGQEPSSPKHGERQRGACTAVCCCSGAANSLLMLITMIMKDMNLFYNHSLSCLDGLAY